MQESNYTNILKTVDVLSKITKVKQSIPFLTDKVRHEADEWLQAVFLDLLHYTEASLEIYDDSPEGNVDKITAITEAINAELNSSEELDTSSSLSLTRLDEEYNHDIAFGNLTEEDNDED